MAPQQIRHQELSTSVTTSTGVAAAISSFDMLNEVSLPIQTLIRAIDTYNDEMAAKMPEAALHRLAREDVRILALSKSLGIVFLGPSSKMSCSHVRLHEFRRLNATINAQQRTSVFSIE